MLLKATIRHVRRSVQEVNACKAEGDYRPAAKAALTQVLEMALEGELTTYIAAEPYERVDSRQAYRCGYYVRWLLTEGGDMLLRVPRIRSGGVVFRTLATYARWPWVVDQLMQLDRAVAAFHRRPLVTCSRYLILDGGGAHAPRSAVGPTPSAPVR